MYLNISEQGNRSRRIQQSTLEASNLNDYNKCNLIINNVHIIIIINSQCTCT